MSKNAPNCPEPLEPRRLFAAGPTVTNEQLLGTSDAVTAMVITFSDSLDAVTAQNPDNFLFGGSRGRGRQLHKTPIETPVYNDAAHTVTVAFTQPLTITRFKRYKIVLAARRPGELADPQGNLLDGNRDGVAGGDSDTRYRVSRGTRFKYSDVDGDRVSLKLSGARGRAMTTILGPNRNVIQIFVRGVTNTLSGSIRLHRNSDGQTVIGRVVLGDGTNSSLLAAPFAVGEIVIDGQTPVNPAISTLP